MSSRILIFAFLLYVYNISPIDASDFIYGTSHSRRYAIYDYDLTTPQYTPDGRLLQVEYATQSCQRRESNPIVSVGVAIPSNEIFRWMHNRMNQNRLQIQDNVTGEACNREGRVRAKLSLDGDDVEGDTVLIMATVSSLPSSSSALSSATQSSQKLDRNIDDVDVNDDSSSSSNFYQRTQNRIIDLPLSAYYHETCHPASSSKATSISAATKTILIGMSGVLSDSLSLLKLIYTSLEEDQSVFGWHRLHLFPVGVGPIIADSRVVDISDETTATQLSNENISLIASIGRGQKANFGATESIATQPSETALRLSRTVADQCQKHAFGGGLRPLGASLLLAGVDHHNNYISNEEISKNDFINGRPCREGGWRQHGARMSMCETDPSGSWRSKVTNMKSKWRLHKTGEFSAINSLSVSRPQIMVSGGPLKSRSKLHSSLETRLGHLYRSHFDESFNIDQKGISDDIHYDEVMTDGTFFLRKVLRSVISALVEEWNMRGGVIPITNHNIQQKQPQHQSLPQIEIVLVSSNQGTFRLTQEDINCIMANNQIDN